MIITYDTKNQTLDISHTGNHSWGTDIIAALERYGETVSLKGVKFGIKVFADNVLVLENKFPPKGVKFQKTNQNTLASSRVTWQPEQTITVEAWLINNSGKTITATDTFTAPLPPQPYPSWTWQNPRWVPPIPYPEDNENEYVWDEETLSWVKYINEIDI